jgi:hypothetical protein
MEVAREGGKRKAGLARQGFVKWSDGIFNSFQKADEHNSAWACCSLHSFGEGVSAPIFLMISFLISDMAQVFSK